MNAFLRRIRHLRFVCFALLSAVIMFSSIAAEADDVTEKWAEAFQPSALSLDEARAELQWFREASASFRGKKIKTIAEDIKTHFWERDVLAKAFFEITGIRVEHEIIGEGAVVESLLDHMQTGRGHYDAYVNDADMVGTHLRDRKSVV